MPPGGAPLRMKKHCRGATRGRPCAETVDIVASVLSQGRAQVPPLRSRGGAIFTRDTKTPSIPLRCEGRQENAKQIFWLRLGRAVLIRNFRASPSRLRLYRLGNQLRHA